jgi:hypothetical protein
MRSLFHGDRVVIRVSSSGSAVSGS